MWNSRFAAVSHDPFDNSAGFSFPAPEGFTLSSQPHLLVAQAFIPPTERVEVAGFDFPGDNFDIRDEVLRRINDVPEYRARFARSFPSVRNGGPVTFDMFGRAIAEFEFTLVFANAPIDRFARGMKNAMTDEQKNGAMLFFGAAKCVQCHAVSGASNEMFSDFSGACDRCAADRTAGWQRDVRWTRKRRGLRFGTGHREPGRPLQVPDLTHPQRGAATGVLSQRSLHRTGGRCPASPRCVCIGTELRSGRRRRRGRSADTGGSDRARPGAYRSSSGDSDSI